MAKKADISTKELKRQNRTKGEKYNKKYKAF